MEEFVVELAGVPMQVRCQYKENKEFLRDYLSKKEPLEKIEPKKSDLEEIQKIFDSMAEKEGTKKIKYQESFLENNAIHNLIAQKLIKYNTMLFHGSALCMDGEAYIFTAPSGTGKSTHARLWREVFKDRVWMINDDKPLLKIENEKVTVYGTPWNGKHNLGENASAPLKAIVKIERAKENHIEHLSSAEAFPEVLKQAFGPSDRELMVRVMELEKHLLEAVDFYRLGCNMEPVAAKTAWEGMNAGKRQEGEKYE